MSDLNIDTGQEPYFPFGFHISRKAWELHQMGALVSPAVSQDSAGELFAARMLAAHMNEKRDFTTYPVPPVRAGHLLSLGLLTEVLRYFFDRYCIEENPGCLFDGFQWVIDRHEPGTVEKPVHEFVHLFPPKAVLLESLTEAEYVEGASPLQTHREAVARELILLLITVSNPAALPLFELFEDTELRQRAPYVPLVEELERFFATQPAFAPADLKLFDLLRAPVLAAPNSLEEQIDYIRARWSTLLPSGLLTRLLLARDILREENLMRGLGPGPTQVLQFGRGAFEYELDLHYPEPARFTQDTDWMSNVVLIAKTVYVWLDQLSKKHQRAITRLDHIPDEELDRLARWGFTGLWLIGVWERSPASQKIKQIMGNPEAVSSAYSLYEYALAADLGGYEAYEKLRERAWRRGIRLASDMVPNHMGIYSKWVVEHPGWFIQLDYPPFPGYQFTGPDLSLDERVGLFIEDGYWSHRDAAVVFKRVDRWTGSVKYFCHGNDGTSMPWNDTAQLNYLIPEVREAVIQTILHVARLFPIIRFDAAMTLAKKHYQRLWFPQPGDGGAIPSRAEHGMTKAAFDEVFPTEFWREVVDRIQQEAPGTLLLAEAFWLMEGYFVRTLGMHRVYNSAFMNMLKMEENAKYRATVKNVLEFSPEVIKRFVNFMNNPDERTAVDQFGKDDKYYGIAMMMVTMPGLAMFGHGQIEGFTEKYGMEYRRAYWDEHVDEHMVARHEAEIFPLMRRRPLFSGVEQFAFYDFHAPGGHVDENVFAYSNRSGADRAVVCYNNSYTTTRGWIHTSTPLRQGSTEQDPLIRKTLIESLGLRTGPGIYYVFRDHKSGLEFLRSGEQIAREGLYVELRAYQYQAFIDFREVFDADGSWGQLAHELRGGGAGDMEIAHRELILAPVLRPFREVMNAAALRALSELPSQEVEREVVKTEFMNRVRVFLQALCAYQGVTPDVQPACGAMWNDLETIAGFKSHVKSLRLKKGLADLLLNPRYEDEDHATQRHVLLAWAICRHTGRVHLGPPASLPATKGNAAYEARSADLMDTLLLGKAVAEALELLGTARGEAHAQALLIQALVRQVVTPLCSAALMFQDWCADPATREFTQMHRHDDKLWVNKERLTDFVDSFVMASAVRLLADKTLSKKVTAEQLGAWFERGQQVVRAAERADYQVEVLTRLLL